MKTIIIPTTQNIELEYPIASVGDRVVGFAIDTLIELGYGFLVWFLCDMVLGTPLEFFSSPAKLLLALPAVFYPLFSEIFYNGQTIGKYAMGMRVIRQDGSSPDFTGYFLRWVFLMMDIWNLPIIILLSALGGDVNPLIPGLVGLITMLINKKGQRLGDLAAGTTVIKLKLVTTFGDTIFVDTKEDYKVAFPEIEHLSDRDVSILKEVLDAGLRSNNPTILNKLANKVKEVAHIKSNMEDMYFLQTVLKDYNHFYGRD